MPPVSAVAIRLLGDNLQSAASQTVRHCCLCELGRGKHCCGCVKRRTAASGFAERRKTVLYGPVRALTSAFRATGSKVRACRTKKHALSFALCSLHAPTNALAVVEQTP